MKKLTCDICDFVAEGNTFEEWMMNLMPHYMQAHADMMKKNMQGTEEEQEAAKAKWMEENKARFEATESDVTHTS